MATTGSPPMSCRFGWKLLGFNVVLAVCTYLLSRNAREIVRLVPPHVGDALFWYGGFSVMVLPAGIAVALVFYAALKESTGCLVVLLTVAAYRVLKMF